MFSYPFLSVFLSSVPKLLACLTRFLNLLLSAFCVTFFSLFLSFSACFFLYFFISFLKFCLNSSLCIWKSAVLQSVEGLNNNNCGLLLPTYPMSVRVLNIVSHMYNEGDTMLCVFIGLLRATWLFSLLPT